MTPAAKESFDVTTHESAKIVGSTLMKTPEIQQAIAEVLAVEGLTKQRLVARLREHVENDDDAGVNLKAVTVGLDLHGAFPPKQNLNLNVSADIKDADVSRWFKG